MEKENASQFFDLIRCELTGCRSGRETPNDPEAMYLFASRFDLAHLIGDVLLKSGIPMEEDLKAKCRKGKDLAFYRYLILEKAQENVCGVLQTAEVPFLPLKGAILRGLYPEPWMRTSCDVDILVHPEDLERSKSALRENGWRMGKTTTHNVYFYSENGVHLELHYDLVEAGRANAAQRVLERIWEFAAAEEGSFRYVLDDEAFCFYHFAHMAKHLESGGCGIRPFLDLWIMDRAGRLKCGTLLKEAGLDVFAEQALALCHAWLEGEPHTDLTRHLEHFLLDGGTYGSIGNNHSMETVKKGSRAGNFLSHVFQPYEQLKCQYPVLEKHRWLTPFMEVARWFRILFRKKNKGRIIRSMAGVKKEDVSEAEYLLESLGLNTQ